MTIVAAIFTLAAGTPLVSGTVTYGESTMIAGYNPAANLAGGVTSTATVTTGVVDPGNAAHYATLAKAGVGATGPTMVTGDIGPSPPGRTDLAGGALAENIVREVGSRTFPGMTSHFEETLPAKTAVTLEANGITRP